MRNPAVDLDQNQPMWWRSKPLPQSRLPVNYGPIRGSGGAAVAETDANGFTFMRVMAIGSVALIAVASSIGMWLSDCQCKKAHNHAGYEKGPIRFVKCQHDICPAWM